MCTFKVDAYDVVTYKLITFVKPASFVLATRMLSLFPAKLTIVVFQIMLRASLINCYMERAPNKCERSGHFF